MEKAAELIRDTLVEESIPVFGIAQSKLMDKEPENYRCSDFLADAKSIICIGMPFPKGLFYSSQKQHEIYWRAANIYYRNNHSR